METKETKHLPYTDKCEYQVRYEDKDGKTVTQRRQYVHQAQMIYNELRNENINHLGCDLYENLRLEEVDPNGNVVAQIRPIEFE